MRRARVPRRGDGDQRSDARVDAAAGAAPAPSVRSSSATGGAAGSSSASTPSTATIAPSAATIRRTPAPAPRARPSPCRSRPRRRAGPPRPRRRPSTSQRLTVASSIDSESCGTRHRGHATRRSTAATMSSALGYTASMPRAYRGSARRGSDALHRRVQVVERLFHAARGDLGAEPDASGGRRGRRRAASSCAASRGSSPCRAARACADR